MLFQYQAWHCPSLCPHSVNAVGSFKELYHAGLRAENSYIAYVCTQKEILCSSIYSSQYTFIHSYGHIVRYFESQVHYIIA